MDFRVTMLKNAAHPFGVLRSKGIVLAYRFPISVINNYFTYLEFINLATGEPPLCMSVTVLFAIRNAIDAARSDSGDSSWYQMSKQF